MPNMGNDAFNYALLIENLGMQIQNIGNQIKNMNNMNIMNNNMIIPNNNIMMPNQILGSNLIGMNNNDEEWMKGFKMGIDVNEEEEEEVDYTNTMNIIFTTTKGVTNTLVSKYGTTIDEILKKYLYKVNKPELIFQSKFLFLFNGQKLKFGDKTKIEDYFEGYFNPKVIVDELHF